MHLLALLSYPYPDGLSVQACAVTEAMSEPELGSIVNISPSEDQAIRLVFSQPQPLLLAGSTFKPFSSACAIRYRESKRGDNKSY